jgi:hypothetical protein
MTVENQPADEPVVAGTPAIAGAGGPEPGGHDPAVTGRPPESAAIPGRGASIMRRIVMPLILIAAGAGGMLGSHGIDGRTGASGSDLVDADVKSALASEYHVSHVRTESCADNRCSIAFKDAGGRKHRGVITSRDASTLNGGNLILYKYDAMGHLERQH